MRGINPIRPPEPGDGQQLYIQRIFPTLQGEGPHAGTPAVFIRLGGCNLACDFCDTEFESFQAMSLQAIMQEVLSNHRHPRLVRGSSAGAQPMRDTLQIPAQGGDDGYQGEGIKLVVLTGGEPLRQNIAPLCEALLSAGFHIQIETNGTLWRDLPPAVELICSPKNTGQGYAPLRPDLLARVNALKYIISAAHPLYRDVGPHPGTIPVYVQPMDEYDDGKNHANLARALELAQTHGYRLSLQLHKLLGIE